MSCKVNCLLGNTWKHGIKVLEATRNSEIKKDYKDSLKRFRGLYMIMTVNKNVCSHAKYVVCPLVISLVFPNPPPSNKYGVKVGFNPIFVFLMLWSVCCRYCPVLVTHFQ